MALVKISKGADIRHEYTDGVSRVPVLEGAYKDAAVERISLQPGAEFSPALYSKTEHNQVFLITAGKGYIATPRRVFNITEVSVFVPDFDKEQFTFHCAADAKECMEIVHFVTELNAYAKPPRGIYRRRHPADDDDRAPQPGPPVHGRQLRHRP